ncbi:c-type cytochrome biogenesis protein CcmI [Parendozoicomonas haliclonae]|uniref:Formate-dependent nitrite reductase complex subunit NrfG n=1 Tax=Parendozoicomonas haliclonae TaxID=1960125 RepID=A0A1X7AH44_9GAMM|nr:c-type cytochrome biogenesis protein CcmI [Parendozoicomonas haliclonae]SMA41892.1 Formate-dependent nitrite reductase complex subunit NrfG [Parendozoicomonas haliclonae]
MMFWIAAGALILLAILFVLLPLRHYQRNPLAGDELDQDEINLEVLRGQLEDLEERKNAGTVSESEYPVLRNELERRLLAEVGTDREQKERSNRAIPVVMAALIPVLTIGLYFQLGGSDQVRHQEEIRKIYTMSDAEQAVSALESVVNQWPEDYQSRYMLAGTYMSRGDYVRAIAAFEEVVRQTRGQQAEPVSRLAEALYIAGGSKMTDRIQALIKQALAIEPDHTTALSLAGIAAFEAKDYQGAIRAWERLLPLTADPVGRDALMTGIRTARMEMGMSGEAADGGLSESRVSVHVSLDKALGELPASARVFVYARSADAPMPIAIVPLSVADLPRDVVLDDSQVMMEGTTLTSHEQVDVVARLSLTGDVMNPDFETRIKNVEVGSDKSRPLVISADDA